MHRIMDAERDATLAYSTVLTREGRRPARRACHPVAHQWACSTRWTRHATSRAGDPNPHDHVLVANVVQMRDDYRGWKAATTALWREHVPRTVRRGEPAALAARSRTAGRGLRALPAPGRQAEHPGRQPVGRRAADDHRRGGSFPVSRLRRQQST